MSARRVVLVIAATDSSGGAGLTRDVSTLSDFHTGARCAVTAITIQSDSQLLAVHHLPPQLIRAQIEQALAAGSVGAIKIGMLGRSSTVQAVADSLPSRNAIPIVLDPVLRSSSGGTLLDEAGEQLLRSELFSRVSLLTPNLPEAAALLGEEPLRVAGPGACGSAAPDQSMLLRQAQRLLQLGPQAVLLKGGHASGECSVDVLAIEGQHPILIEARRVAGQLRGTGCALSSAIAAQLCAGQTLPVACRLAQDYVVGLISRGSVSL